MIKREDRVKYFNITIKTIKVLINDKFFYRLITSNDRNLSQIKIKILKTIERFFTLRIVKFSNKRLKNYP